MGSNGGRRSIRHSISPVSEAHHPRSETPSQIAENIKELTDEQLVVLLDEKRKFLKIIQKETNLLECFYKHISPKDIAPTIVTTGSTEIGRSASPKIVNQQHSKNSRIGGSIVDHRFILTSEQKNEIALKEIEYVKEMFEKQRKTTDLIITDLKVKLDEAHFQLIDVKNFSTEFLRDVVKGGVNPQTGDLMTEKVFIYFDRSLRNLSNAIERYRMHNPILKNQEKKLIEQKIQRDELGDTLREVDFNQLKIENDQYQEKLEERNQAVLHTKFLIAQTLQMLSAQKMKLHQLSQQNQNLKDDILSKKDLTKRLDVETSDVALERDKIDRKIKRIRQQMEDYRVPDIMEYIDKQAEVHELRKQTKTWQRKTEVAQKFIDTQKAIWKKVKKTYGIKVSESQDFVVEIESDTEDDSSDDDDESHSHS